MEEKEKQKMMQLEIAKMNAEAKIRKDDEERDARIQVEIMHVQYECKNRKSRTDEKTAIKQPLLNAILFLNKDTDELRDKYVTNCKACGDLCAFFPTAFVVARKNHNSIARGILCEI